MAELSSMSMDVADLRRKRTLISKKIMFIAHERKRKITALRGYEKM